MSRGSLRLTLAWRTPWRNRRQSLLALLAIGSGVFVLTALLGVRALLVGHLTQAAAAPAPDTLWRVDGLPPETLAQVQALAGVRRAVGSRVESFRVQYGDELWSTLRLQARSDLADGTAPDLYLEAGEWPQASTPLPTPAAAQAAAQDTGQDASLLDIALELSARDVTAARPGAVVRLYSDDLGETPGRVAGLVYDPAATPSRFLSNLLWGFAPLEGLAQLSGGGGYNWLAVWYVPGLAGGEREEEQGEQGEVEATLAAAAVPYWLDSGEPPAATLVRFVEAALAVLLALAGLGALLGIAWCGSVMAAVLAREETAIAVLKTLGCTRPQIAGIYLGQALLLGVLATALALPLGGAAARLSAGLLADGLLAKPMATGAMPLGVFAPGLLLGLAGPLLGALPAVWRGTGRSVQGALARGPEDAGFGGGRLARAGSGRLPPPALYIGRNLLRNRGRVLWTTAVLALAGTIFITVASLSLSLQQTLRGMMNYWLADVRFETSEPVGAYLVRNEALALPGVTALEARLVQAASRLHPEGAQPPDLNLVGLPPASPFLQPALVAGRWLREDDTAAVVVDTEVLRLEPALRIGDDLVLDSGDGPVAWEVVGVATSQLLGYSLSDSATAYVPYRTLSEVSGRSGEANFFLAGTAAHDPAAQLDAARRIEESLHRYRFSPAAIEPNYARRQTAEQVFALLTAVILVMSVLFALAGALSLDNLVNLNVVERSYEIAAIRALGGDRRTLLRLVAGEALGAVLLSALLAALLAWPLSALLCRGVGLLLLNHPLAYGYAWAAAGGWLLLSAGFGVLSSFLPLRRMAAAPVRAGLARR